MTYFVPLGLSTRKYVSNVFHGITEKTLVRLWPKHKILMKKSVFFFCFRNARDKVIHHILAAEDGPRALECLNGGNNSHIPSRGVNMFEQDF